MTNEKLAAVTAYKATVSVFRKWLRMGLISYEEYAEIDTIISKKYGLYSYSIFSEIA